MKHCLGSTRDRKSLLLTKDGDIDIAIVGSKQLTLRQWMATIHILLWRDRFQNGLSVYRFYVKDILFTYTRQWQLNDYSIYLFGMIQLSNTLLDLCSCCRIGKCIFLEIDSEGKCQLSLGIHISFHFHLISNTNHG